MSGPRPSTTGQGGAGERPPLRVTLLRTSCLLLECGGRRLLTDPFFSRTMRGLPIFRRPGVALEDLPPLDVIAASHLHPDHFDRSAARRLAHPTLTVVGPPGTARQCRDLGLPAIVELAPWQSWQGAGWTLHATPALHTGPLPAEVNFVIEVAGHRVFFGGDTRLHGDMAAIAARLGPLDVALLPIGGTRIFGHRTTMDPRDAVQACALLRPRYAIPIHEGGEWLPVPPASWHPGRTWQFARGLCRALSPTRACVVRPGETAVFSAAGVALRTWGA